MAHFLQIIKKIHFRHFLIITLLMVVMVGFALFFVGMDVENNTLAMDWKIFWPSLRGGNVNYLALDGLRFPPWSILPLIPLGYLPMKLSWGILAAGSLVVLVLSVPKTRPFHVFITSIFLLITSFPFMRNMVDGNVEAFVVGGTLLALHGFRNKNPFLVSMGILLATIKVQEVTLLILVLGLYMFSEWEPGKWIRAAGMVFSVVAISMVWRGPAWVNAVIGPNYDKFTNSIIDVSLSGAMTRAGMNHPILIAIFWVLLLGITLVVSWRSSFDLTREKAGMLIAASILISPYAAGNSVLTVLAVGIIPLFQKNRLLGGTLIAAVSIPYLFSKEMLFAFQAYYWTLVLLTTWMVLSVIVFRNNPISIGNIFGG